MRIAIDCDNVAGQLKNSILAYLKEKNYDVTDLEFLKNNPQTRYPQVAENLAKQIITGCYDRGILLCGTGLGMAIAANKVKGIYAGACHDVYSARRLRRSNKANILTMGARVIGAELAKVVVEEFLLSEFEENHSGENVKALLDLEENQYRNCTEKRVGKKLINEPENCVEEMLEGFLDAYGDAYVKASNVKGFAVKNKKEKVGILIGGGSGHEPLFGGFVGEGMADGVAMGNVFASPDPGTILEMTKMTDMGKGVLYLYGNYAGDNLNFTMAGEFAQMEGIPVKMVAVSDDVASAPYEDRNQRRGIAGDIFVLKIAAAAAEKGYSLEQVYQIANEANENVRSIGIALSFGSIPGQAVMGEMSFDELEYGMGLHGEPGIKRATMEQADAIVEKMMCEIMKDMNLKEEDEVCVLVNGLGSTTMMELCIVNRMVTKILKQYNIKIYHTDIHSYCTSMEMAGASISLMKLNEERKELYDMPAKTPYYTR